MINPAAIKAYIAEKKETYSWMKSVSESEIWQAIEGLDPQPTFHTTPFHHQAVCFYIGVVIPAFGFFLEMRTGKSKIILDVHTYRAGLQSKPFRTLILVPQLIHFESWVKNVERHAPHLRVCAMEGSTKGRLKEFADPQYDVYVLNYAGLFHMVGKLVEAKKGRKMQFDEQQANTFTDLFSMLVCDESTAIKNPSSLTFKVLRHLSHYIPYRYCLTGTPNGRSLMDLWSQLYVLDHGEALGGSLAFFQEVYFTKRKLTFGRKAWTFHYTFREQRKDILLERLAGRAITYTAKECMDMPRLVPDTVYVKWNHEARVMYSKVLEQYREEGKTARERENNFIKLRQISGGFLRYDDPLTHEKKDIVFSDNPKLDALVELIHQAPPDAKFVIFHFFVTVGELIANALKKEKVSHVRVWGGAPDKRERLRSFQTKPDLSALIVNETMGAMALDLQVAGHIVFFDLPVSPITRKQAEFRCLGPDRKAPVFLHDLVMMGSVDERIVEFLKEGKDLREEVMRGYMELE